jgi:hypothetical protein
VSNWQPIETAPKGSKSVLLGCDYDRHGKQRVTLAWWDEQFEPSAVSGCWIEGWFYDPQEDQNEPMRVEFRPSHWMPLPEPPEPPKAKEAPRCKFPLCSSHAPGGCVLCPETP